MEAYQHEYSQACQRWFSDAVHIAAGALDPVYNQIQWRQMEVVSETLATISDSQIMTIQPIAISADSEMPISAILNFDLPVVNDKIVEIAEQFARQTVLNFLETISAVTEATGNTVQAESGIDGFIAAIEKVDIEFDENGAPTSQIIVHPATYEKLKKEEAEASPEKLQELATIIERKRREYFASRRNRRLPRLSYGA